ncbi:uncharacterized protein LOC122279482 [Carya illinoinensis]|uniref:uncharacterized protein LOC122279482 n=1 Tax=Carya illinoinensis TaxID=32201 RepID=UPI001C71A4EA|nr:uncharacterized protein LOC122279482 [Carya illinoinensis]
MRPPRTVDGELCFLFSQEEIDKAASSFRLSMVIKFLRKRPSLDKIRAFIWKRWGLSGTCLVSSMRRFRNVFVRMTTEEDFIKAFSRESCEMERVPYRAFQRTPDFNEDSEPPLVPVWIFLPDLSPHFYHNLMLKILTASIGTFIKRDNVAKCVTRTYGARVCVETDASKPSLHSFWIGHPGRPLSRLQEVVFETLPAYCTKCNQQGHNQSTCRKNEKILNKKEDGEAQKGI